MIKEHVKQISTVYDLLGDDISREIFANRLMFNLTADNKFLRHIITTIDVGLEVYSHLLESKQAKAIFGAGEVGRRLLKTFDDIEFCGFIDNKKNGQTYEGLPVYSLENYLNDYDDGIVVISTKWVYKEIYEQLISHGVKKENIINIGEKYYQLSKRQYFDLPILTEKIESKEVFLDGGAYDGETSIAFVEWYKKSVCQSNAESKVYIWEPGTENNKKIAKNMEMYNIDYTLIKKGLWNNEEQLRFKQNESSSQIVLESNDNFSDDYIEIEVNSIDAVMPEPATFIKMDIEGSEKEALMGAKEMISKYKPKLAISVYHKKDDIWELPWLIYNMNPEYKFYMRHYSFSTNETVVYAV